MKKMMTLVLMMTIAISANAMSYTAARHEALFLSDKMAYELGLTDEQYAAVYEINLDYMMSVNGDADVLGPWWKRRNADLRYVLTPWQYDKYIGLTHFYRPLSWHAGTWRFNIYGRYANRDHFYRARPSVFVSYMGGNNRRVERFYADRWAPRHAGNATWRATGGNHRHQPVAGHDSRRGHGPSGHGRWSR